MITIGSRVKFLHSTGAGIVRSIKDNMAYVEVDGFEIPALISDVVEVPIEAENAAIVRIGPSDPKVSSRAPGSSKTSVQSGQRYGRVSIETDYEDDEIIDVNRLKSQYAAQVTKQTIAAQPAPVAAKIEPAPYEITDYSVSLAFVPAAKGKPETQDLDAYLVNDSSYEINYCIGIWRQGYVETIKEGKMEADSKVLVRKFPRAAFAQVQTLYISLQPFKKVNFVPRIVENFYVELHPLKFVRAGNYSENDYFDEPSFLFTLSGEHSVIEPEAVEKPATQAHVPKSEDARKPKTEQPKDTQIEDLHIESLMESWESLTSGEVLASQLARFTFVVETALKNRQRGKVVFIHGIGKGKLKYELKKTLDKQYPKLRYQDASFAEYGYGAIMVFFQ